MKTLHLTLKKKWFDLILEGKKKIEYREIKPYWTKRLFDSSGKPKRFDIIEFRNGYSRGARKMRVEWKGVRVNEARGEYEIGLRKVFGGA